VKVKKQPKRRTAKVSRIEQQYLQVFKPHSLPREGPYPEEESLEQPSELIYVPATSTPAAKA